MAKRAPHVELFSSTQNRKPVVRWRLIGGNGEPMARSQGYTRKWSAKQGARRACGADVEIRDLTGAKR